MKLKRMPLIILISLLLILQSALGLSSFAADGDTNSITIVSPNGGETWEAGSTQTVSWSYTGNPGSTVKIRLYKGSSSVATVVGSTAIGSDGSGAYTCTWPASLTPGDNYRIRIYAPATSSAYSDYSDAYFTLSSSPPALSSAKEITAFSFAGLNPAVTGTITGNAIALTVPETTDVTNLAATFTNSAGSTVQVGGTVQTSGTTANDFTNPVSYAVTAEDGTTATYTATVTKAPAQSTKEITAFSFADLSPAVTGTITGNAIALTVPHTTDVTNLAATFTSSAGSTVQVGGTVQTSGTTANDFTSPVVYTVTAEDSSTVDYTVTVAKAAPVNQPPAVTITSPADRASYVAGAAITLTLAGTVTDEDSGLSLAWQLDGQPVADSTVSTTGLDNGLHTITATATDSAGLEGTASVTFNMTLETVLTATLIHTIDTSAFIPPSPDPSGIDYLAEADLFIITDCEVDEMLIFTGANLFETDPSGNLVTTGSTLVYSTEPTGVAYNPHNEHVFITDDSKRRIVDVGPGDDRKYEARNGVYSFLNASSFGSKDIEGVAYDPDGNTLYVSGGVDNQIYSIPLGEDGKLNGTVGQITHFDVAALGVTDPEGIGYNPATDHLYIVGQPSSKVIETTKDGVLYRQIDISAARSAGLRKPAGLGFGPSSANHDVTAMYITDRGYDNTSHPDENDGKVFELSLTPPVNQPPAVTITSPAEGASYISGTTITLAGTVVDEESSLALAWQLDGQPVTGSSISTAGLALGLHTITATATDSEGLEGTASAAITVTAAPPAVTITSPEDGASYVAGAIITLAGTVDNEESGLELAWWLDGQPVAGSTISTAGLAEGLHTITATATDSEGIEGTASVAITVTEAAYTSTLINTIDTSAFVPASPDPSGIDYLAKEDLFIITDSEVDEMLIFADANLFKTNPSGSLVTTGNALVYSAEPTGIAYNPNNEHVFIADDVKRRIFDIGPGEDRKYEARDGVYSFISTYSFGCKSPTGVAYDPDGNTLFVIDDANAEVYSIPLGPDGTLNGTVGQITHFDTAALGVTSPGGIGYNPATNHLYIVGAPKTKVIEVTKDGVLYREINISTAAGMYKPAGLGFGPSSTNHDISSMYITDQGRALVSDGKVFELSLPTTDSEVLYSEVLYGTASANSTVIAANTAPVVTITSLADGASYIAGKKIKLKGSVADEDRGLAIVWQLDGQAVRGSTISTADIAAGTHVITATATDSEGLAGTASANITVTVPVVTITSPAAELAI